MTYPVWSGSVVNGASQPVPTHVSPVELRGLEPLAPCLLPAKYIRAVGRGCSGRPRAWRRMRNGHAERKKPPGCKLRVPSLLPLAFYASLVEKPAYAALRRAEFTTPTC